MNDAHELAHELSQTSVLVPVSSPWSQVVTWRCRLCGMFQVRIGCRGDLFWVHGYDLEELRDGGLRGPCPQKVCAEMFKAMNAKAKSR